MADENTLLAKANANTKEEVNIKDLPNAVSLSGSDAIILVQNSAYTKQANLDDISTYILKENSIPSLTTNHKDIVDAINEVAGVEVIGILPAYSRTLVLRNANIKSTSNIRVLTEEYTIAPTNVVVSSGSVILTFEPRDTAIKVKVKVS